LTYFSEAHLHRIHHVRIGQIFSNHTQRQETFSRHKPGTLLLVSELEGSILRKSRVVVAFHHYSFLSFSLIINFRQKYNEFVLCVKKNEGDEGACLKQKQMAYSICPDDWVGYVPHDYPLFTYY